MTKIKCVVIDDEELARTLIKSYIDKVDFLELVDDFENPIDAIQTLKTGQVHLVFLDIQMPQLKGTEFAKIIDTNLKVIFTTAYTEYALEGYELNVLDYLLKPITFERFMQAVNKYNIEPGFIEKTITVKSGYDLHKLHFDEILFIESDSEYVNFYTESKKIMSHQTLKTLQQQLPTSTFIRVHRSYIVNKQKVSALKGRNLQINNSNIPVSDSYIEMVKAELF